MISEYLHHHGISYSDVYDTRSGKVQFEAYGTSRKFRNRIPADVLVGTADDEMHGEPYALVRINPAVIEQQAMNEYMAIG